MATPSVPMSFAALLRTDARMDWRTSLVAIALALAWLAAWYAPTAIGMVTIWARSETFMHGFLIAPISLWLIARKRHELAALAPHPDYRVLVPIAVAGLAWLVGAIGAVDALSQFAFVFMLVLAVPMLLGMEVARAITFPLAFLLFMVPFGEFLLPPLMEGTASVTIAALRLTGVPVYREGLQFVIPSGKWSVVEACSGVRYLIASMVAGSLFAYLNYHSTRRRVVFFALSILVPIVANWIRAYLIVLLGHLSDNTVAVGVDHLIYGWVFFGVVLLLLFWVGSFWREPEPVHVSSPSHASAPPARQGRATAVTALIAFAVVSIVWPLAEQMFERRGSASPPMWPGVKMASPWSARAGGLTEWSPRFVTPSAREASTFERASDAVALDVMYYRPAADGRKLVTSDNVLVMSEDPRWAVVDVTLIAPKIAGLPGEVRESVVKRYDGARLLVWQWYWVDGQTTASDALAKLYGLRARIAGRSDDGAALIVSTRADTIDDARKTLARFASEAAPAIEAALQQARSSR